jgi:hypothetical protein
LALAVTLMFASVPAREALQREKIQAQVTGRLQDCRPICTNCPGWIRRRAALAEFRAIPSVAAVIPIEEPQNAGLVHKQGGGAQITGGTPEMLEQMGLKAEIGSTRLARGNMSDSGGPSGDDQQPSEAGSYDPMRHP